MLERLITTNSVYMRHEKTKEFNEKYITQLIRNYRSHSSILHISNKLFYDDALRVCAPEGIFFYFPFYFYFPSNGYLFHTIPFTYYYFQ